jgi:MHS family proline/betaine transporter-like MFS transporter
MRKVVISGMIGNALEWYDFALYGHFAAILSKLFFPATDAHISLIATFSVFAAGFIMRPIGGILFGYIGDKYGRRVSLAVSILTMAIPTACIGLLPTYEQIGILAPIALTIIRLLQGLSLGGAFSGCIAFVVEHAPSEKRGLAGSTSALSMCAGILLGLGVASLVSHMLPQDDFETWGWRIPFLISIVIGIVGFYIRNHLDESPKYLEAKKNGHLSKTPVREVLTNYKAELAIAVGIYLTVTVPFYTLMVFMNSYMNKVLGHPLKDTLIMNAISIFLVILLMPLSSAISDKVGRKPVLAITSLAFVLLSYPIFHLLCMPGFMYPLIGQLIFGVLVSFYVAPVPATLVELFPTSVRFTGVAISYNLSAAIFGGTTPAVATWLIKETGMKNILAFYIMLFATLTLFTLYYFKDKYNEPLA